MLVSSFHAHFIQLYLYSSTHLPIMSNPYWEPRHKHVKVQEYSKVKIKKGEGGSNQYTTTKKIN